MQYRVLDMDKKRDLLLQHLLKHESDHYQAELNIEKNPKESEHWQSIAELAEAQAQIVILRLESLE